MAAVTLTLSCSSDALASTVQAVEAAGVVVAQVHRRLGIVVGDVSPERIPEVLKVAGVQAVEPAQEFRASPPDSDVQ